MGTTAQLNACIANAQHSTGPRSPEGKAVSSRNALKFGLYAQAEILPGEDPAELDRLVSEFEDHYLPRTPVETRIVRDLARAVWLERRYARIEAEVIQIRYAALPPEERTHALGAIYIQDAEGPNVLHKIERRRAAAQRQVQRALKEIQALGMDSPRHPDPVRAPAPPPALAAESPTPSNGLALPSVRFDKSAPAGPTPLRTPRDSSQNPALRL